MTKSSPALNIPNKRLKIKTRGPKLILHSISQERRATQKDLKTDAQEIQSRFYKRYIVANQSS